MFLKNLDALFEEFLTERKYLKNISHNTVLYYRQSFKAFKKYGNQNLTQTDLNKWIVAMREAEITPKSCNTFISAINSFLHWLHESEVIEKRIGAKLLKLEDDNFETLNEKQLNQLISFKPKTPGQLRTHTILLLLIDTGMRIDEALSAELSGLDLEQSLITIKGKGKKVRTIPLSFEMRRKLYLWTKKRSNPSKYLFPTSTFNRMEYHNFRRDLLALCKLAMVTGVRIHPHGFRHYYAKNFLRRGGDIYRLSQILGHSTINSTVIYLRSMGVDELKEIHQQVSPLVRN